MVHKGIIAQVKDKEGATYKTVKIGTQTWMAENLNTSHFANGDTIPEARTDKEWEDASVYGKPAWCYYKNDPANGARYGKIYNKDAIQDNRGLLPKGWIIPKDVDWGYLIYNLGKEILAGNKMKATSGWNKNANGDNSSGFNAIPGGMRFEAGSFVGLGSIGYWWSSDMFNGHSVRLHSESNIVVREKMYDDGFSVRAVKYDGP